MNRLALTVGIVLLMSTNASAGDKVQEIDSIVKQWQSMAKFNGSVLVAQHGNIILHKGYGIRAVDQGNIVAETTLYMIGGMTEMFTAALVFKLQEQGKLSIDDTLGKYLAGYPNGGDIRIKHLLSHQSGIFDYMANDSLYTVGVLSPREQEEILSFFRDTALAFEPGTKVQYSTSNYYLLGMVIEKVYGDDYYTAVRKEIFEPLKIENSGFNYAGFASWDKSQGYNILNTQRFVPAFPADSTIGYAAAGLFTSTTGLYKWVQAMQANKLLKESSWQAMTTEQGNEFGYGWEVKDIDGKKAVGHTGETYGFVGALNLIEEDSTVVIVLSNDFESEVYKIKDDIIAALYDKPYKLPRKREHVFLEQRRLDQYSGTYELPDGTNLNLYSHDKMLWGKIGGQSEFTLLADLEPDVFFMSSVDVEFYFIRDKKTNLVTDVIIRQNRKEQKAHKWQ